MTDCKDMARERVEALADAWLVDDLPPEDLAIELLAAGLSAVYGEYGRDGLSRRLEVILERVDSLPALAITTGGGWADAPDGQQASAAFAAHAAEMKATGDR